MESGSADAKNGLGPASESGGAWVWTDRICVASPDLGQPAQATGAGGSPEAKACEYDKTQANAPGGAVPAALSCGLLLVRSVNDP